MIWLVTLGLSRFHGSELLVGWQWLTRLSAAGPTTAIVSKVFDSEEYLLAKDKQNIHFIDTKPASPEEINKRHLLHTYRFWRGARNILADQVKPGDKVVIVAPAAVWFMPWLPRIPIARSSVYYGPLGAVLLPHASGAKHVAVFAKNALIVSLLLFWRLGYRWLPGNLSLRFPANWFSRFLKGRYTFLETVPEVEVPLQATINATAFPASPAPVAVLFDDRVRKNFANSISYAAQLAQQDKRQLIVVGAPDGIRKEISVESARAGCGISFQDRLSRTEFMDWLGANTPIVVSLSLSEGVPSTLIEALCKGCEVHIYPVGGLQWLITFAATRGTAGGSWGVVERIRWDDKSLVKYRIHVEQTYARLVNAIADQT